MDSIAIWIALAAVFIALIPVFAGSAAKARRDRAAQAEARRRGDHGSVTATGAAGDSSGEGPKSPGHDNDGGWGSDGGDGGGGGD